MPRLAATVLISNEEAFVSKHFQKSVYVGEPSNVSRIFSDLFADELFIFGLDDAGSPYPGEMLRRISGQTFIPLTFGGSIDSVERAMSINSFGFEKISVESALFSKPKLIRELADTFGETSTIASFSFFGMELFSWRQMKPYSFEFFVSLLEKVQEFGAGEVKINSMSRDGTLRGPDLALIERVIRRVEVPLTYQGGVRSMDDVRRLWDAGVDCVSAATWFTLLPPHDAVLVHFPQTR